MKNKIYQIWEMGYVYIIIAALFYIIYALNGRIGIYDWQKEIAYFGYIKQSLTSYHSLPLFWWNILDNVRRYPAIAHTHNFIGNPETMLFSPFVPLLLLLNSIHYIKLLTVIHFLVGVAGAIALRKRLSWNSSQFRVYLSLFLFSPVIIQHLAIGYTPWLNIFLFPWLVYFMADNKKITSSLGVSGVLGLILLQGGTHVFVWFVMFFMLYTVCCIVIERDLSYLVRILSVGILVPLLAYVRVYTTAKAYGNFHQAFAPGYNPLNFALWALIPPVLVFPFDIFFYGKVWLGVPSWDGGVFWGLSILMFLALAIKYRKYEKPNWRKHDRIRLNYDSVFISVLILFSLAFFSAFEFLITTVNQIVNVPFSEGAEKYPFRLVIPAFLGFSIIASQFSHNLWNTFSSWIRKCGLDKSGKSLVKLTTRMFVIALGGSGLFLILSVIFANSILLYLKNIVKDAYYGGGYQWLSRMVAGKNHPLEHYWSLVSTKYTQLQSALLVLTGFTLVVFLALRNATKVHSFFKKSPYFIYEFALVMPLLFCSAMWLTLAVSVPFTDYPNQEVAAPKILTRPYSIDSDPLAIATPQKLTIYPKEDNNVTAYVFPNISAADGKFLDVVSGNGKLAESNGQLSVMVEDEGPITLAFRVQGYKPGLYLTIGAWTIFLSTCIVIKLFNKVKNKSN